MAAASPSASDPSASDPTTSDPTTSDPTTSGRPDPGHILYLDNLATTPLDPRVLEVMVPFFTERFGNASSRSHAYGWDAAAAVEGARAQVASLIGATPREIVFTSGATEANNLAIKGAAEANRDRGDHLVTCVTEHHAVLDVFATLERQGYRVSYVGVDANGLVDLARLQEALEDDAILLSTMAANNEIGTVAPLAQIGRLVQAHGIIWHCDAAQAVGKVTVDVAALPVDLLSMSAHKLYGPKGQGALFVRRQIPPLRLRPQIEGGGQERGLRSGTLNVPGIVGFGEACRLCAVEMPAEAARVGRLRDTLQDRLQEGLGEAVHLNGHPTQRLPGALNVSFAGVHGSDLLTSLPDLALSSGSACTSGATSPSHVLRALGRDDSLAAAALRFGLGRFTTDADVAQAARRVIEEVERLRANRSA